MISILKSLNIRCPKLTCDDGIIATYQVIFIKLGSGKTSLLMSWFKIILKNVLNFIIRIKKLFLKKCSNIIIPKISFNTLMTLCIQCLDHKLKSNFDCGSGSREHATPPNLVDLRHLAQIIYCMCSTHLC